MAHQTAPLLALLLAALLVPAPAVQAHTCVGGTCDDPCDHGSHVHFDVWTYCVRPRNGQALDAAFTDARLLA